MMMMMMMMMIIITLYVKFESFVIPFTGSYDIDISLHHVFFCCFFILTSAFKLLAFLVLPISADYNMCMFVSVRSTPPVHESLRWPEPDNLPSSFS